MNYFEILGIVFLYMNIGFILSIIWKRNDLADIFWGPGFVVITVFAFFHHGLGHSGLDYARGYLILLLVALWSFRLSFYIWKRNKGNKEDWRYLKWRQEWGKFFYIRSYFQVWILQGILMFIIAYPLILQAHYAYVPLNVIDISGFLVWIFGFMIEVLSDEQLRRFKSNTENKGKIMTEGLWKYSRHPNYFGEALIWWGIAMSTFTLPNGWVSFFSASVITFFLLKVSGVVLLESAMNKRPGFAEYKKKTSAFILWPPKK